MYKGTDETPCDSSDDGLDRIAISNPDDNDDDSNGDGDNEDEDGDSDVVDGPTVKAHIDLAKTKCEYYFTGYCPIHVLTYIYSAQNSS